jgi:hypothetical protein
MEKERSGQRPVETNSTEGQGSRRAVASSDDDILITSTVHNATAVEFYSLTNILPKYTQGHHYTYTTSFIIWCLVAYRVNRRS